MTEFQKPDDVSLEDWEDYLESRKDLHKLDALDTLDQFRRLLNDSQIEAMALIKKRSQYGNECPYYLKAKQLFARDTATQLFSLLEQFTKELEEEDLYVQYRRRTKD